MYQRLLLLALLIGCGLRAEAQQLSRYSMPWLDVVQFNPAYAGLDNSLSVTGTYRNQWTGLQGSPVGQRLSAHLPIYFLNSGFGIEVERDEIGARSLNSASLSYNYQLVRGGSVFSFGLNARYQQFALNGGILRTPEGQYEDPNTIIHNDDLLPIGNESSGTLALGAGVYYQSENFEGGLSARNLNGPVISLPGVDYLLGQQFHGFFRARLDLITRWEALPFVYAVSDGTQTQISAGGNLRYQENFFGGAAFRTGGGGEADAVVISTGFNLSDKIQLAYAYDITLSALQTVNTGSHEITLKYNLRKRIGAGIPPPIIYYPRAKQ